MTFTLGQDKAVASSDGEHLALEAKASFVESGVGTSASVSGTRAVFSRTAGGWAMMSATASGATAEKFEMKLLSPEFSQVALVSYDPLDPAAYKYEIGAVGGPYPAVVSVPNEGEGTQFVGANAGTASVPAFSDVLLQSHDHALLPPGRERERAEEAETGAYDLYEWSGGRLRLINVNGEGGMLSRCGAVLGAGYETGDALNAVSQDGSKIFFTSPERSPPAGCEEASRLYMQAGGMETVEVSAPEGVSVEPSERQVVRYDGATPNGAEVFFSTETALTPDAPAQTTHLYEYDTEAPVHDKLKLIANGVRMAVRTDPGFLLSEDGSTVYYEGGLSGSEIFRYETLTGKTIFVAAPTGTASEEEPSYTTANGDFLVFSSGADGVEIPGPRGRELEVRGIGHNELYRYDAATGSVMCISCGEGVAPATGKVLDPAPFNTLLGTPDSPSGAVSMSEDGRRAFFQSSAQLVPQDTNASSAAEEASGELGAGADVYEWEQEGTEEAPGSFCGVTNGCTHLISSGEDVGPEHFLGASASGENVFFTSTATLVPQATSEFTNIYDARLDGGFASSSPACECLVPRGLSSPAPVFGPGASLTFTGADNPLLTPPATTPRTRKKSVKTCVKGRRRNHGKCVKAHRAVRRAGQAGGDRRGRL
jgi:hypothetical protein